VLFKPGLWRISTNLARPQFVLRGETRLATSASVFRKPLHRPHPLASGTSEACCAFRSGIALSTRLPTARTITLRHSDSQLLESPTSNQFARNTRTAFSLSANGGFSDTNYSGRKQNRWGFEGAGNEINGVPAIRTTKTCWHWSSKAKSQPPIVWRKFCGEKNIFWSARVGGKPENMTADANPTGFTMAHWGTKGRGGHRRHGGGSPYLDWSAKRLATNGRSYSTTGGPAGSSLRAYRQGKKLLPAETLDKIWRWKKSRKINYGWFTRKAGHGMPRGKQRSQGPGDYVVGGDTI